MNKITRMTATALLLLAACGGTGSVEGSWTLQSGTIDGDGIQVMDTHPVTLVIDADNAGGVAACNSYGGTWTRQGERITFEELVQTEMACMPDEVMQLESRYLQALDRVDRFQTVDGKLILLGDGVRLVFTG